MKSTNFFLTQLFVGHVVGHACLAMLFATFLSACSDKPEATAPLSQEAQLIQQGSEKARMCAGCHGPKGISRVASYPSLAGKSQEYLAEQLHAFRNGTRENPMMTSIAKSIAEDDVLALSHYFASLPGPESEGAQ